MNKMDSINRTLYIPLYGKTYVSRKGILLQDPKAEEIWRREGFSLKGTAASKWLAYSMAMRAAVFDEWTRKQMDKLPGAVVLHLGCGLDSRVLRVHHAGHGWFDLDFPEVIRERKRYFCETENDRMIPADLRENDWLQSLPEGGTAIILLEGLSMYFRPEELAGLLRSLNHRFEKMAILMDCYSSFAAKASKYKNPINQVGVTVVYGMDDPKALAQKTGLHFVQEHSLTPAKLQLELTVMERSVFSNLYAGRIAKSLYKLY